MNKKFVITATGTDIGKTVFSAMLVTGLGACYWKPVQAGVPTDTDAVRAMTGLPETRFYKEAYRLNSPLSPHKAAAIDGVTIDIGSLNPPESAGTLIIEGAGGLMVPMTPNVLQIDLYARWKIPVVLVARTELGTINHTLLSLEALKARNIPVLGVAFIGPDMPDTIRTIERFGRCRILGRLPVLPEMNAANLGMAFEENFRREDFLDTIPA